jgi:hypothetical protein
VLFVGLFHHHGALRFSTYWYAYPCPLLSFVLSLYLSPLLSLLLHLTSHVCTGILITSESQGVTVRNCNFVGFVRGTHRKEKQRVATEREPAIMPARACSIRSTLQFDFKTLAQSPIAKEITFLHTRLCTGLVIAAAVNVPSSAIMIKVQTRAYMHACPPLPSFQPTSTHLNSP